MERNNKGFRAIFGLAAPYNTNLLFTPGKSSVDWYFGFKLHLIINDQGELLAFQITPGNIDERKPVPTLAKKLWGRIFGDKGYISKDLFKELF